LANLLTRLEDERLAIYRLMLKFDRLGDLQVIE
jgi:hypothetical protein